MHKIQRTHATQGTTSHNPDTGDSDQYETQSNHTLHTHNTKAQKNVNIPVVEIIIHMCSTASLLSKT